MSPDLKRRIDVVRAAMTADPSLLIICDVRDSARRASQGPRPYAELLEVTDGARFGPVVFWSAEEYPAQQWRTEQTVLAGMPCVGALDDTPIAIDAEGRALTFEDPRADDSPITLGSFDALLAACLGEDYLTLPAATRDDWWNTLVRLDLIRA